MLKYTLTLLSLVSYHSLIVVGYAKECFTTSEIVGGPSVPTQEIKNNYQALTDFV